MDQQELRTKIIGLLEENAVGTLASVMNGKPHSRYMTFFNNDLTLYTPTNKETHKAEEIDNNPYVHILLGYQGEGFGDSYLEIEGKAAVREDADIKEKLWNDHLKPWFKGKDDPDYIVLEIKPSMIRLMNNKENSPQTLEL
ncbi:pyridoxamine 5'-phosphate oxidase family protein [Peribacillus deserti]|uniref:General stress protein n=1 Tax=Peribacillus deserti TaxID=673318 RepID=A0A2N5M2L1_9BACI|nr:pyridoxamine 5'-phosphate oxidase family protein [Peribacillus deserti]PLT28572.1 general stress protein [Peribacillus deserti]